MPFATTCPTKDELSGLLAGKLDRKKSDEFLEHVDRCSHCQEQLDEIGNVGSLPADARLPEQAGEFGPAFYRAIDSLRTASGQGGSSSPNSELIQLLEPATDPRAMGRLAHYDVFELIGNGGMGLVVRAHDSVLDREVAIKILAPYMSQDTTARERFAREARAAAAINHDNVLSIYSVSEAGGLPFLVMPYVAGRSLAEKLDRETHLPMREVLRIGMQTARGLAAAHAAGVIHRDIKPSNLLLDGDQERVKIADFGLASVLDDSHLTQSGTVPGTPEFMAPEQALGQAIDARADLFSLGTVLYLMCTGQSPFRASTPLASLRRVSDDQPRPVTNLNPEASAWFAAVVTRLLEKSPTDRYQTAAEVAESLEHQLANCSQPRRPPPRANHMMEDSQLPPHEAARCAADAPFPAIKPVQSSRLTARRPDRFSILRGNRLWVIGGGIFLTAFIVIAMWTGMWRTKQPTSLMSKSRAAISSSAFPAEPVLAAGGQALTVKVRGKSDPFLAGMPHGTKASGGDKAPAESPVIVHGLRIDGGMLLTFSAHGATRYDSHAHMNGPDGGITMVSHSASHQHGISNLTAPIDSLVGVFLGREAPNLAVAPPALDFSSSGNVAGGINYETLKPALQQIFFIGDGKTASGVVQTIRVPVGATRLALATWDRQGWFNNAGSLEVTVTANATASDTPAATDKETPMNRGASTKGLLDIARRAR